MAKRTKKFSLGESLNIEQVGALKEKFDQALTEGALLSLNSDLISDIDLSGIQLLNYMIHQAGKRGAGIKFSCRLEKGQKELLSKCGFNSITEKVFA